MIGSGTNMSISCLTPVGVGSGGTGCLASNPIASGATFGQAQAAVEDAGSSAIVLSLSGAPQGPPAYDAAGLLNSFVQAGTAMSQVGGPASNGAPDTSGLAAGAPSEAAVLLGAQDASGPPATAPAVNLQDLWASALKANPAMSATVAGAALDQGLVSTLSVVA